ncbi:hypothetical protein [Achromobacter aloeverae]
MSRSRKLIGLLFNRDNLVAAFALISVVIAIGLSQEHDEAAQQRVADAPSHQAANF